MHTKYDLAIIFYSHTIHIYYHNYNNISIIVLMNININ